jgi:SAM-dependent methyltransferase
MLLKRIVRSLRNRGIVWSADRAWSVLQERFFDWRYGTDTVAFVEPQSLKVAGPHAADGTGYQPTRLRFFRKIMSELSVPAGSAFVDFGCGKGRVLLLAADYGFQRITGVEFAGELCGIARENTVRYLRKSGIRADIRVIEGDAVEYEIADDENFFFMFNPCSALLVEKIVRNIARSLAKKKRRVFIIYNNPVCREVIEQQGFLLLRDFNAGETLVYSNAVR